jgi:hypothetical protein
VFEKWMPSQAPNSQHWRDSVPMTSKMRAMIPSSPFCEFKLRAWSSSIGAIGKHS